MKMEHSLAKYSMLFSVALLFTFISPSFAEKKHPKLVQLCSKSSDPNGCLHLMKADSRVANAESQDFTEIAIDLAYALSKKIQRDIQSANNKTKDDSDIKFQYGLCSKNYEDTIRDLERSKKLLKNNTKDYRRIEVQVNDAVEEVGDCKNLLSKLKGDDASRIKRSSEEFELLCNVVKVSFKFE